MKKFQNLIGFPVRLYDNTLDIINRGLKVLGVPLGFTVGGIATGPQVTAAALTAACVNGAVPNATTAPMNIYLATAPQGGSDITGDGTQAKPFLTFNKALSIVPRILRHKVTLFPGRGDYADFPQFNEYEIQGGFLCIDGSSAADYVVAANRAIDTFTSIADPGSEIWLSQANRIKYLGVAFGPSINVCFIKMKTGSCTGQVFSIFDSDPLSNTVDIGPVSNSIVPGDLFDLIFAPVGCHVYHPVEFNMHQTRNPNNEDQDLDPVGLAISQVWFSWSTGSDYLGGRMLRLVNTVAGFAGVEVYTTDQTVPCEALTLVNSSVNTMPLAADTFTGAALNDNYKNWLSVVVGFGFIPVNNVVKTYLESSQIRNMAFRGKIIITGNANLLFCVLTRSALCKPLAKLRLLNLFIQDETLGNTAIDCTGAQVSIQDLFIDDCENPILMDEQSNVEIGFAKMAVGAVRGVTAIKAGSAVSAKVTTANFTLAGTSLTGSTVQFLGGDASEYNALAAAGSALDDSRNSWIQSV